MFRRVKNKFLRYFIIFIYFAIIFLCAIELNFLGLFGYSPTTKDIETPTLNIASELYTDDGKLIARYFKENRSPVVYDSISTDIVNALVSTEDIRFFKHSGVDFFAVASSLVSTAHGEKRGGSTITQQLAKNLYRTRYQQSAGFLGKIPGLNMLIIKIKEWFTAVKLERKYSKEHILTMYLNTVSFGNNTYGIKTAAKRYFNSNTNDITASQAALLIGMLKATTLYNPIRNPEQATKRRNIVLSQMLKADFISSEQYKDFITKPLGLSLGSVNDSSKDDSYLRAAVERTVEKWCEENGYDLYEDGLKIYTTIDSRLQAHAEKAAYEQMAILQERLDKSWANELPWRDSKGVVIENFLENLAKKLPLYDFLSQKFNKNTDSISYYLNQPKSMKVFTWEDGMKEVNYSTMDSLAHYAKFLNTGMMALDPYSSEIKVWVGGINHSYYKYDHVNQAKRQAGSTFKPFAYLAAIEEGMSPCDKFPDKAVRIDYTENGEQKSWEPKNADWTFSGLDMSLRWAMGRSINSVTAQITEKVGWDKVVETAHKCGITSHLASVPSVGLGSNDVTVFEMVSAYATFLNKGNHTTPILVKRIVDRDGKTLAEFKAKPEQVIDEETAWLMTYMLRGTMEEPGGTSQALWEWDLWKDGNQIGGKTGTSSNYVDGWYIGITKDLVTGVWVGNDERSIHFRNSATGEGSRTALPIFATFMEQLYHDPNSGYTYGPLPDPTVPITRKYNCPSPRIVIQDSTATDSVRIEQRLMPTVPLQDEDEINRIDEQLKPTIP
ncbi:transglycosylase domain-containing protein [Olivibacter sp. SDN3]|uniref:transglycosylase domain-containing protein n=1 Tax=Olivibacter sp. SDN3 TaxID=2764720 RepID=UPI001650DE70|nr:transglycosylase domain-containing protein [Olivibacter sp. SDN3]QNL48915.1 transglycosylase domain-containing protein [Olivibacter sp. SDN3]